MSESTSIFKLSSLVIRDFHVPNQRITTRKTRVCFKYSVFSTSKNVVTLVEECT